MRIAAALLTLLALGCGQSSPRGPQLRYVGTGLDQKAWPLVFALQLTNDGEAPVVIDDVRFRVTSRTLLYDDVGGNFPNEFNCEIHVFRDDQPPSFLLPGDALSIAPGEVRDVRGVVGWVVPPDSPPMLAIVCAELMPLRHGEEIIHTEPLIMVLQSTPGALDTVRKATTANAKQAMGIARGLRAIEGKRSAEFDDLIRSIEETANRGI